MAVNKIVTKVDGVENKTIDFNDLKAGLAAGGHTVTVAAYNGATLVNSQTRNITIAGADTTAPTITTVTVEDANPDKLVVVFSEAVTITNTTGLTITGDATPTLSAQTGSGSNTITFTLSTALTNGQSVTLNVASSNTIKDAANNSLAVTTKAIANNVAAAATYDPDYQAVLDYATANGIALPSNTKKTSDNQRVLDDKASGLFARCDYYFIFDGTAESAYKLICYKRLISATPFGSLVWSTSGVQGNGTNAYINTHYNPATNAVNYSINDASINAVLFDIGTGVGYISGIRTDGGDYPLQFALNNANENYIGLNNLTGVGYRSFSTLAVVGLNSLNRYTSTGVSFNEQSEVATTSSGLPNGEIILFANNRNYISLIESYNDAGASHFFGGASMNDIYNTIKTSY